MTYRTGQVRSAASRQNLEIDEPRGDDYIRMPDSSGFGIFYIWFLKTM
jgi:acetoacetate decarboxylase